MFKRTPEQRREERRRYKEKDPERARLLNIERLRRYRERHPERYVQLNNEWRRRNPEKRSAQNAVQKAIRKGKLVRQPCWCGDPKSQAHHKDYSKKLDVVWLCQRHHGEMHRRTAWEQ